MPQRAVHGAGSRERRRLESPLFRPLARPRAVADISITLSLEKRGRLARSTRVLGVVLTWRTVQLLMYQRSHSRRAVTDRFRSASADALADCSDRRVCCCLNSLRPARLWLSEFPGRSGRGAVCDPSRRPGRSPWWSMARSSSPSSWPPGSASPGGRFPGDPVGRPPHHTSTLQRSGRYPNPSEQQFP
jgi:hypothetical protein